MTDWRIEEKSETVSTNDDAKTAAEKGEAEGLVVWALKQSGGRGRHGRSWESPEGNLYCSVLLRPKLDTPIGLYSFVAANAMYDTVRQSLPVADINLKWPNDVLVEGKKIGGILLEVTGDALIMGMGLNVTQHPTEGLYPSTSLVRVMGVERSSPPPFTGSTHRVEVRGGLSPLSPMSVLLNEPLPNPPRKGEGTHPVLLQPDSLKLELILDNLLMNIDHWYGVLQSEGFGPVRAFWLKRAAKGTMKVRLPTGEVQGDFVGLDENGCLRLHLADGSERAIATGDVFVGTSG